MPIRYCFNKKPPISVIVFISIFFFPTTGISDYFDRPLFNYSVQLNNLPYGNYKLIRSHKNSTQLLYSENWSKLTLLTDRKNYTESTIHSSSYERTRSIILNYKKINQGAFLEKVDRLLRFGDKNSGTSFPFPGLIDFHKSVKSGTAKVIKEGTSYSITIKDSSTTYKAVKLTINIIRNSLTIRRLGMKLPVFNSFDSMKKPVFIDQTNDPLIISLLREYYLKFHIISEDKKSGTQ